MREKVLNKIMNVDKMTYNFDWQHVLPLITFQILLYENNNNMRFVFFLTKTFKTQKNFPLSASESRNRSIQTGLSAFSTYFFLSAAKTKGCPK